ncbi:MAG: hypothetical protein HQL69_23755 [Magnetococcales bacterium]|nr:hypothetical protein [Magnetococcales bacterium]
MSENFSKLSWETIEKQSSGTDDNRWYSIIKRARIHGGWLVYAGSYSREKLEWGHEGGVGIGTGLGEGLGLTFIPDRDHQWQLQ